MIPEEVYKLLNYFEKSSLSAMELEMADFQIKLNKAGNTEVQTSKVITTPSTNTLQEIEPQEESKKVLPQGVEVKAPLVGIFYEASSPEAPALAPLGSTVKKGQVIGLIESMKMFSDIISPVNGTLEQIFVSNGELVEYGTTLFEIKEA